MYEDLINIPRVYTALAEWLSCMIFYMVLPKKVKGARFICIAGTFLVVQCLLLVTTEQAWIYMWFPIMVGAVGLMFLFLSLVTSNSMRSNLYFTLKAFLAAEFAASLEWQFAYFFRPIIKKNAVEHTILLVVVYGSLFAILYLLEKKISVDNLDSEISRKELVSVGLIVLAVFGFSNLSFLTTRTPFSGGGVMDVFNARTLVDFGGLAILYAYQSRVIELQAEKELLAIHTVLQGQYDNYRNYSESIDLINLKYHDLKHQIEGLKGEMSQEKRYEWIAAIEDELQDYQPEQQTGNYTLDTLLTGKLNSCRNQNIKFTCVADGKLLSFMHVMDICSIFGNALDNAIENVSLVEEEEKRLIHMKVFAQGALLCVVVSNYCNHSIEIKNGFPITTKSDKKNHGFGIKSIYYAVKKYNGNVSFGVDSNMFELKILIPIK